MKERSAEKWSTFRLSVVGQLLHAPAENGELAERIRELAETTWTHPISGEPVTFGFSTIERWFQRARRTADVFGALKRKTPQHAGTHPSIDELVDEALRRTRLEHPTWSTQLVYDNIAVELGKRHPPVVLPSYATVCRYSRRFDLGRRRPLKRHEKREGFVAREKRSFEASHVGAIWHGDFHQSSRRVLVGDGEWRDAVLLAFLDDRSRLCCHAQWYTNFEDTEAFVHGLWQALLKRGRPRILVTDNGSGMVAAETQEGLKRIGIEHRPTLSQTPEQNGKQEVFWARVEGRLMAMVEGVQPLTLEYLNRATQAWVEGEYQTTVHRETKQTPHDRWLAGPDVLRPSPPLDELRHEFRMEVTRRQRRGDGTISVEGIRFELPNAYRTLREVHVRYARWDLSTIDLVDAATGIKLASLWPIDKEQNADARRREIAPAQPDRVVEPPNEPPPLLRELLADYAATGLPPAYIPLDRPAPSQKAVTE